MSRFGSLYVQWLRSRMPDTDAMTLPRLTLLGLLAGKGERVTMTELSEMMGVSPRNITVLVDGLERAVESAAVRPRSSHRYSVPV